MCFLCLDGLHIFSRQAHLVLNGELGKRKLVCHDEYCVGSMKKGMGGKVWCDDHFCEWRWFKHRAWERGKNGFHGARSCVEEMPERDMGG